ncbi:MAG: hypothetical protein LBP59_04445 [Planctomycetaceae bacterium]|nr:hypothetical protein [Planctomycetaceae bacterium]
MKLNLNFDLNVILNLFKRKTVIDRMECDEIVFKHDGIYFNTQSVNIPDSSRGVKYTKDIGWLKASCKLEIKRPFRISYNSLKDALTDKCTGIEFELVEPKTKVSGKTSGEIILHVTYAVNKKTITNSITPSFDKTDTPAAPVETIDGVRFFDAIQLVSASAAGANESDTLRHIAIEGTNIIATDAVVMNVQKNITLPPLKKPFILARQFFIMFPQTGTCQLGLWHDAEGEKLFVNFTYNEIPVQIYARNASTYFPKWQQVINGYNDHLAPLFKIAKHDAAALKNEIKKLPLKAIKTRDDKSYVALTVYKDKLCVETFITEPKDNIKNNTRLICSKQSTYEQAVIDHELLVIVCARRFKSLLSNEDVKIYVEVNDKHNIKKPVQDITLYESYLAFKSKNSSGALMALTVTTKNKKTNIQQQKYDSPKLTQRDNYNNALPCTNIIDLSVNSTTEKINKTKK